MTALEGTINSEATNTVTLTAGWTQGSISNCYIPSTTTYHYPQSWYYTPSRIRLTLSEIEKLRAAAKKDKALVAILEKFTDSIEVTVDFK